MIVIAKGLVLGRPDAPLGAKNPLIGWHNLVTAATVSADSAAPGFPATNLGNPSTNSRWRAEDDSEQHLTVQIGEIEPIDYIAVARHNFGSAQIAVSVEGRIDGEDWTELVGETLLPDDVPALFRFAPRSLSAVRLRLGEGELPATAAVLYAGRLLILQRRIYVGHTPLPYGRTAKITNARSESGNFLGRIVLNEKTETQVAMRNLAASWYRTYMDPFIVAAKEVPFFFAWRPADYPREVGFAWMTNDPHPSNARTNGMMQLDFQMTGIVA
jgi:hypothetical protein